jgi:rRNA maturation protein Nop10
MFRMRLCGSCRSYTLLESHCGAATVSAHPARFKPDDPYGRHRRAARFGVE